MSDDEGTTPHEDELVIRWLDLLDEFAQLPAHRQRELVKMLELDTAELAANLSPGALACRKYRQG
jgi:hypothetical protein